MQRFFYLWLVGICLPLGVWSQKTAKHGELLVWFSSFEAPAIQGAHSGVYLKKWLSPHFPVALMGFDTTQVSAQFLINRLSALPSVRLVQQNHFIQKRIVPDDTGYTNFQWNMKNTGQLGGLAGADIAAEDAWNITTGGITATGDTIVVAVVDDGFQLDHPDLVSQYWINYAEIPGNAIDDDANGYVDDYLGYNFYDTSANIVPEDHGTHVAGIIGAQGNNNIGVAGVNWNVKILPLMGSTDSEEAPVVASYLYVLYQRRLYNQTSGQQGAFIVSTNASFGVDFGQPQDFPIWCALYDSLGMEGILSAGAVPNLGINIDQLGDIPGTCNSPFLIAVTNTTRTDNRNNGSGYGSTHVDIGAPGTQVYSTRTNGGYVAFTGTSMATPHVAGAVALYMSGACHFFMQQYKQNPDSMALVLRNALLLGVDSIGSLAGLVSSEGRLNVFKGLQQLSLLACTDTLPPITSTPVSSESPVFQAFPNPFQQHIHMQVSETCTWQLFTLTGQLLLSGVSSEGTSLIDASFMPEGVYLLRVQSDNRVHTVRMIKNSVK